MNPTPTTDTQRLRELLAAATPGPLRFDKTWNCLRAPCERIIMDGSALIGKESKIFRRDADLIAALRNETPALLDEIEGLRIDRRNLIEEMERRDVVQEDRIRELLAERDSLRRENEELKARLK